MSKTESLLRDYDACVARLFGREDRELAAVRARSIEAGLPEIAVSASEGRLLQVLALSVGARRILEIGTLGGYSATWLARALPPDGRLISLEIDPHHAQVARENLERAGLAGIAEVRVGPAAELLERMAAGGEPAFDLAFIDADKEGYEGYLRKVVPLVREGGLILADNTLGPEHASPHAKTGIARYNAAAADHPELCSMLAPVFRGGGSLDGLTISVKRSTPGHA